MELKLLVMGYLIGMIVSPIVLGIIFFGIFAPISLITYLFGRDELHLQKNKKKTYWVKRKILNQSFKNSLKNQF